MEPPFPNESQAGDETAAPPADELQKLQEKIEVHERRIDELSRAYADVLNERESFRRRLERERDRQLEVSKADTAQIVLDTMDDLRRACASNAEDARALSEGVRLIADGLQRRLESMGITPIETEGKAFDPLLHEAIDLAPTDDRAADGLVVEETRGGWRYGERVLRPARVRVARYLPPVDAPSEPSPGS